MSVVLPEGPLVQDNQVVMGYWSGSEFYILCYNGDTISFFTAFTDSTPNTFTSKVAKNMIKFSLNGSYGSIQFKWSKVDGLTYTMNDGIMVASPSSSKSPPINFNPVQSGYQDWGEPTLLLAGVAYDIRPTDNNTSTLYFYIDGQSDPQPIQPIMIPTFYYAECADTQCKIIRNAESSIRITYCSILGLDNTGVCVNISTPSWTDLDDAMTAVVYNYCPVGNLTCQPNCKSPCTDKTQICEYNSTDQQFECKSAGTTSGGSIWTKAWIIIIVIGMSITIMIMIIILIFMLIQGSRIG